MNSPNISNTSTKPRENRGRALLLEHLPDIKFRQSIQGVLFIVFSNGEAFFYPLNDQSKGNHPGTSNPARLLTLEPSERTKKITQGKQPIPSPTPTTPSTSSTGSSKYFFFISTFLSIEWLIVPSIAFPNSSHLVLL